VAPLRHFNFDSWEATGVEGGVTPLERVFLQKEVSTVTNSPEKSFERLVGHITKAVLRATRGLSFDDQCSVTMNLASFLGAQVLLAASARPHDRAKNLTVLMEDVQKRVDRYEAEVAADQMAEGVTTH
jgi:hypothetical protein